MILPCSPVFTLDWVYCYGRSCPVQQSDWLVARSAHISLYETHRLTHVLTRRDQGRPLTPDFSSPVQATSQCWLPPLCPQSSSSEIWASSEERNNRIKKMKIKKDLFLCLCVSLLISSFAILFLVLPYNQLLIPWPMKHVLIILNIFSCCPAVESELKGLLRIFWWWSPERQLQRGHR